ncbi:MAG TPA: ATP-binding cassette domain-containing protein [Acidimicrobiales bacterium]|nr:ATP-binding cassette domain-containing protein [Acidimicrobiales bacterium]
MVRATKPNATTTATTTAATTGLAAAGPTTTGPAPPAVTALPAAVHARGLSKRYGDPWALRELDLDVPAGSVLGLLGHNGAGKTTAIRILTTLARPTHGTAAVAGHDVVARPDLVRRSIGVAAQQATVDGLLTARANLVMVGRLHGMPARDARRRADDLLARFHLRDEADDLVKTFSGGMRRRLDLAASLVSGPAVLFLDEPTTGLDPRSRGELWDVLRTLVSDGTTIVLTTQYLEEADRLADEIVVLDHGRAVAQGSPVALKAEIGGDRIDIAVASPGDVPVALAATERFAVRPASVDETSRVVTVPVSTGVRLIDVVRALDDAGVDAVDANRRSASLDDVFLTLTDPSATPEPAEVPA